jgi:hypothetical protein
MQNKGELGIIFFRASIYYGIVQKQNLIRSHGKRGQRSRAGEVSQESI